MPGYDRTGPLGSGPRTGRGLGRCGRDADTTTPGDDPTPLYGAGRGGRPWGGGRGRRFGGGRWGRGRGFGRGFGIGWGAMGEAAGPAATSQPRESFLIRRMDALAKTLDQVKELLSKRSPSEEEERG